MLGVADLRTAIDVTHRPAGDLLDAEHLPTFLAGIGRQKLWGTKTKCSLWVLHGDKLVAQSQMDFDSPVRPFVGKLGPSLGAPDGGPKLQYTGVSQGRTLHIPAIDGCYYYAHGGRFETDNRLRGLNCITYAGAVFGVPSSTHALSHYGTQLANHVGATPCGLENKTGDEIKSHFAKNPLGTYLMWSAHHVVVVVDSKIHEFALSKNGYVVTDLQQWHFSGKSRWWVRKTRQQF
jgi:hypothetical protein